MLQCNEEVTVNQKAYKLIKLLGHGKGGYSYLAKSNNELVVLKQIHHETFIKYYYKQTEYTLQKVNKPAGGRCLIAKY